MADVPRQREPAELIARAAGGDSDAFAHLYASYERLVLRYVQRRVGNWHIAEDIAAATWVRALAGVHRWVEQGRDPGAWLVTIARNLVADYFKSGGYRFEVGGEVGECAIRDVPSAGPEPQDEVVDDMHAKFRAHELCRAIRTLSVDQRKVVLLRLNGLSVADTARATGRTEGAVKSLQYRATRELRRQLAEPKGQEFDTPRQGIASQGASA